MNPRYKKLFIANSATPLRHITTGLSLNMASLKSGECAPAVRTSFYGPQKAWSRGVTFTQAARTLFL
nr:MAG TPA: hypothetical protein [Caudoviricetes sp.]